MYIYIYTLCMYIYIIYIYDIIYIYTEYDKLQNLNLLLCLDLSAAFRIQGPELPAELTGDALRLATWSLPTTGTRFLMVY